MGQCPNIWEIKALYKHITRGGVSVGMPDGTYEPARPEGFWSLSNRLWCAWMAFTGRADIVFWRGQGDDGYAPERQS